MSKTIFIVCPITRQLCLKKQCSFDDTLKSFTNGLLSCVKVDKDKIYFRDNDGNLTELKLYEQTK